MVKLEIYNENQEYYSDLESFCDQNCVQQVLKYLGVKNPLCYFNTALNIHLIKSAESAAGYDLEFDNELLLDAYTSKVKKIHPFGKSNQEVWKENKERLREGIPVIAGIDVYYLNHTSNYRNFHSNHKCILCGYTEDDKYATIIDWYEWKYKGNVNLEEFMEARSSDCPRDDSPYSGVPIENIWLEADERDWSINVREALKCTFDKTLKNYYENTMSSNGTDFYGIAALKKLKETFFASGGLDETVRLSIVSEMRIIVLCLYTRLKLFRGYVKESTECINKALLAGLLVSLDDDIEQWHKTSMMLLKATFRLNNKSFNSIVDKIGELIIAEEKRYQVLMNLYSIL